MELKGAITQIASVKGGRFKSTREIAESIEAIIGICINNQDRDIIDLIDLVRREIGLGRVLVESYKTRGVTRNARNQINIRRMFENAVRCPICGGVLDLQKGKQYDHYFEQYAKVRITEIDNMMPVHPFCNNMKDQIEAGKSEGAKFKLPNLALDQQFASLGGRQLTLF